MKPTCEDGRHRGGMKKEEVKERQETGENGDEDEEAWAENEMSTRCKKVKKTWLWTIDDENEDNIVCVACSVKEDTRGRA